LELICNPRSLTNPVSGEVFMLRTKTMDVTFRHPFTLKGLERAAPPGFYRVETEEEPIDGLSFPAYRRLATLTRVPMAGQGSGSAEVFLVDPKGLTEAKEPRHGRRYPDRLGSRA
jgi:hypothetical protein